MNLKKENAANKSIKIISTIKSYKKFNYFSLLTKEFPAISINLPHKSLVKIK